MILLYTTPCQHNYARETIAITSLNNPKVNQLTALSNFQHRKQMLIVNSQIQFSSIA